MGNDRHRLALRRRRLGIGRAVLALGLLAGACSGDDDAAPTTTSTSEPAAATDAATGEDADEPTDDDGFAADDDVDHGGDDQNDSGFSMASEMPVTLGGVGFVSIGMDLDEAALEIGFDASEPGFRSEAEFCAFMDPDPASGYDGLGFMVYDGVVQRIDVFEGAWATPSGASLGTTMEELDAIYGDRLETEPHAYVDDGSYVRFVPADPGNDGLSLLFEVIDGAVATYRVGFEEPVGFVEGCA